MRLARWGLVAVIVAAGLSASAGWTLLAQERAARPPARGKADAAAARPAPGAGVSMQDALLKPFDLPFGEETTLEEVRQHLGRVLGGPVVLDRSALDRLELDPEDTVQLDLKGVRLKVGLKLLLDQVGMTYRVVPEDNLLILTDAEGSDDPDKQVLAELKAMHREIHDLQDAVDDLADLVEEELGVEPAPAKQEPALVRWGSKRSPRRATRATPGRVNRGAGG